MRRSRSEKNNAPRYFLLDFSNALRYSDSALIASFKDASAKELYETGRSRRIPTAIQRVALRKLKYLNNAADLNDLRVPPANRLEALSGERRGQHSIRINDQYRICFVWENDQFHEVEIVDYH